MAREGPEKLLNITDRSYNVLYYIDFTYSTCVLQLVQCQQLVYFLNSLKRKIEHVYFSRLERQRTLSLSLSLSLKKNRIGSSYVEPTPNHEMVRAVLIERQTSDCDVKCRITFITNENYCRRMWNSKHWVGLNFYQYDQ